MLFCTYAFCFYVHFLQHLSQKGHELLARGILDVLSEAEDDIFKPKRLGSFGLGDQCYQWFADGNIPIGYTGGALFNLIARDTARDPSFAKWVLEMDMENGGSLTFESKFAIPVPIGLSYMSKQEGSEYTIVEVSMMSTHDDPKQQKAMKIDPNYNLSGSSTHITVYSHVGWAAPGMNTLHVKTIDRRKYPFRVVGIFLCGHCAESGDMGNGALSSVEGRG